MKIYTRLIVVLFLCLSAAFSGTTSATTVSRIGVEEMASAADLIVEGVVEKNAVKWDETGRMIITETTVVVSSSLKGRAGPKIVVRTLGGQLADVGLFVAGAPSFKVGDSTLLILERHPTRDWRVMGLNRGKFDIRADRRTGETMAVSSSGELTAPLVELRGRIKASIGKRP